MEEKQWSNNRELIQNELNEDISLQDKREYEAEEEQEADFFDKSMYELEKMREAVEISDTAILTLLAEREQILRSFRRERENFAEEYQYENRKRKQKAEKQQEDAWKEKGDEYQ